MANPRFRELLAQAFDEVGLTGHAAQERMPEIVRQVGSLSPRQHKAVMIAMATVVEQCAAISTAYDRPFDRDIDLLIGVAKKDIAHRIRKAFK
jgi:hypothetical protein